MANQMLVDATHPEETRVVVVRGNRVEEFDFESANRKQLRGNIYLAKVTRVEPSLQAAFVDYGGNRHGFLAFSEIHPDYYQIPVADRQALLEEEKQDDVEEPAEQPAAEKAKAAAAETDSMAENADATEGKTASSSDEDDDEQTGNVEQVGAEDAMEEVPERRSRRRSRQYKIQEVIKRRQILLVQVVKEERGNKGAALTTYLSLAGRYSVLMPNTARGGGISRKITNVADRKRLKQIASDLEVADGMGVILRTAGASRTKSEIKRDFEYLLRLWENVRDLTLQSAAPLLVYEEGSLIKRSIRDLYNKDIDQVLVAGEEGYKEAKGFMRMLMPSHARNVQPYREPQPIFTRCGIESQLDAMFSPQVTLKSGGYIVIDQTEALVSIDVNSGRSTREHNIEDTALSTNVEAAEEIARQLRLRDLAGLVVIDFIDMEEKRNNRAVEKRLKDCLKSDRARIQVGRISHFGLMEMSRQRIRTGVLESTMDPCPHCHGTGYVRAAASVALLVLRTIEDHLLKGMAHHVVVKTRTNVALYILNQKRANLAELESRFGVHISIEVEENLEGKHLEIERGDLLDKPIAPTPTVSMLTADELMESTAIEAEDEDDEERQDEESSSKKRRRRRRRKKPSSETQNADAEETGTDGEDAGDEDNDEAEAKSVDASSDDDEDRPRKSRRRGRRGGRRNRRSRNGDERRPSDLVDVSDEAIQAAPMAALIETGEKPKRSRRGKDQQESLQEAEATTADEATTPEEAPAPEIVASETVPQDVSSEPQDDQAQPAESASTDADQTSADTADEVVNTEIDGDTQAPDVEVIIAEAPVVAEPAKEATPEAEVTEQTASADTADTSTETAEPVEQETSPSDVSEAEGAETAQAEDIEQAASTKAPAPEAKADEEPRPKRTGWWNRGFF